MYKVKVDEVDYVYILYVHIFYAPLQTKLTSIYIHIYINICIYIYMCVCVILFFICEIN